MRAIAIILACVGLAACAQARWMKPGATTADFDQDKVACQYEAAKATGNMSTNDNPVAAGIGEAVRQNDITMLCLRTKGWTRE